MFFRNEGLRPYLPPDRREPLGGRSTSSTGRRHPRAARSAPAAGQLDGLLARVLASSERSSSCPRTQGAARSITTRRIGPPRLRAALEADRLPAGLRTLLDGRRFEFDVERAVFLTVLHRLVAPAATGRGAVEGLPRSRALSGSELHHLYRAMALAGRASADASRRGDAVRSALHEGPDRGGAVRAAARPVHATRPGVLRHHLDLLRGRGRRDASGGAASARTTGPTCGRWSWRLVLDGEGRPVCCELWPGNTADVRPGAGGGAAARRGSASARCASWPTAG